ncbi:DUF3298 and DUF4163 domain-containing protein [Bacillus sp. RG28]|uniref:DUF3298 and DUF4163 domain-containing protein n=1 Tax=Gottfriedia endophytica TaxID=2820819 RepID=A0A940NK31_9BACI|nr:DUF3298 and DUF4163 domain-containing protein [Gottfriedia endophytica]MBP0725637.1 DUF3298 and DUF4163 domain-containing protein [Gottfriedia endophytica]
MKKIVLFILMLMLSISPFFSNEVKAKAHQTTKLSQLALTKKAVIYEKRIKNSPIFYPQIKGLANQKAQRKINATLLKEAQSANKNRLKLLEDERIAKKDWKSSLGPWRPYEYKFTYKIPYNDNNHLSVIYYQYIYTGGAHGNTKGRAINFNTSTGEVIPLSKVINGKQKVIQNYAYNILQKKYKGYTLIHSANEIALSDQDRLWVFDKSGIKLIFNEYEVAAYAAGMPEVVIPSPIYK